MSLARPVVRVLAHDDDLDIRQIDGAQRRQRGLGRRVDLVRFSLRLHKRSERLVPVARRLLFERFGPTRRERPLVRCRAQRRRPRTDADASRPESSSAPSESIGCLEGHEQAHAFRLCDLRLAAMGERYARILMILGSSFTPSFLAELHSFLGR